MPIDRVPVIPFGDFRAPPPGQAPAGGRLHTDKAEEASAGAPGDAAARAAATDGSSRSGMNRPETIQSETIQSDTIQSGAPNGPAGNRLDITA